MRTRHLLLAAALVCSGCHRSEGAQDGGAPLPPGPVPHKPKPQLQTNASLDCEKLVPKEVRDTWLKDWTPAPRSSATSRRARRRTR